MRLNRLRPLRLSSFAIPPKGDRGRGQRVHRGRDRQAHGLAARRDDGDEGRARGKGQFVSESLQSALQIHPAFKSAACSMPTPMGY